MRFLLAAVNAKYIHSNLAVYSLRAFAKKQLPDLAADLAEYTINQQEDPEWFMEVLLALAEPKKEGETV